MMKISKTILLFLSVALIVGLGYFAIVKKRNELRNNAFQNDVIIVKDNEQGFNENTKNLSSQTNSEAGISFEAAPKNFNIENPVKFEIKIDTHSGSLDFDLAKISFLEDDKGNQYKPLDWQGPAPGGHHLEGTLIFPEFNEWPKKLKLVLQTIPPRIFEWSLE